MVNSPNNPSGSVYTEEEMAAIAAVLSEHPRAIAISDEIYEYINFTEAHASLAAQPGMMERTVTVNGVSKGFAMTGWRIGYIAAPQWIAAACTKLAGSVHQWRQRHLPESHRARHERRRRPRGRDEGRLSQAPGLHGGRTQSH